MRIDGQEEKSAEIPWADRLWLVRLFGAGYFSKRTFGSRSQECVIKSNSAFPIALLAIVFVACATLAMAQEGAQLPGVFQMPGFVRQQQIAASAIESGRFTDAERALHRLILRFPKSPSSYYLLAAALAGREKNEEVLDKLAVAASFGFNDADALKHDPHFEALKTDRRFQTLVDKIGQSKTGVPKPADIEALLISNRRAIIDQKNTIWDPRITSLRTFFRINDPSTFPRVVRLDDGPVSGLLNGWFAGGTAAGNIGDLYDNRDDGHSRLDLTRFPQLAHTVYGSQARKAGILNDCVNSELFFNAVTIGNCSKAITNGALWRSLPRWALSQPGVAQKLYLQYANDHLYVYPEHADHDSTHGDLLPANTPYMVISQGSSRSDKPFLEAISGILAALKPEVKRFLREKNLLMPTVQMILRRGQSHVRGDDRYYLSGIAHPSVFDAAKIDPERQIRMANGLQIGEVPPAVHLRVLSESPARSGMDYFSDGLRERLFDTPGAISRIVRSTAFERRIVMSAAATTDPNGRDLEFRWTVLRGDARRIKIVRRNEAASEVEIIVPWHDRMPVPGNRKLSSHRVDIGVFADNGAQISAPAFISFLYPDNEIRRFGSRNEIISVDYRTGRDPGRYSDPVLFPRRDWMDEYEYDREGRLMGWKRTRGEGTSRFTRHGARVLEMDAFDRPVTGEVMRYPVSTSGDGTLEVRESPSGKIVRYTYMDVDDRLGIMSAVR